MTVQELVEKLYEYNPDAEIFVCANNRHYSFSLSYGDGEGVEKENCDNVSFYVDELNTKNNKLKIKKYKILLEIS